MYLYLKPNIILCQHLPCSIVTLRSMTWLSITTLQPSITPPPPLAVMAWFHKPVSKLSYSPRFFPASVDRCMTLMSGSVHLRTGPIHHSRRCWGFQGPEVTNSRHRVIGSMIRKDERSLPIINNWEISSPSISGVCTRSCVLENINSLQHQLLL